MNYLIVIVTGIIQLAFTAIAGWAGWFAFRFGREAAVPFGRLIFSFGANVVLLAYTILTWIFWMRIFYSAFP